MALTLDKLIRTLIVCLQSYMRIAKMSSLQQAAMPTSTISLLDEMAQVNVLPLWDRYKRLNTREPQYYAPMIWPWARLSALIERSAREVSMDEAERRVLLLTHPAFSGTVFTTPTLSAGLQILEPGESAHAHRHTLAALRLAMIGDGAVTVVDGKACPMAPGDLILTPAWSWHEHRHEGSERAVWFDGLDYPLGRELGTVFFEEGPGAIPERGLAHVVDDGLCEGGVGRPAARPPRGALLRPLSRHRLEGGWPRCSTRCRLRAMARVASVT